MMHIHISLHIAELWWGMYLINLNVKSGILYIYSYITLPMVSTLTLHRLAKEESQLEKEPLANAIITRQLTLNFYFTLYNLQGSYTGGFYFGLLELHQNYPFSAPKLIFYTPSGRFDTNLPICTSFTNYHQQTWTSAWNVRTLILATISFMYSEEPSYGCCHMLPQQRMQMAKQSLKFNLQNQKFVTLFSQKLKKMGLLCSQMCKEISCKIQQLSAREELENNFVAMPQAIEQVPQIPQIIQVELQNPLRKQQQPKKQNWIIKILPQIVCVGIVVVGYAVYRYLKVK